MPHDGRMAGNSFFMWRDTKKVGYSMMSGIKGGWSDHLVLQEIMSLFKISVSLVLIALSTRCAANEESGGGFGYSCQNTSLVGNVLYSSCQGPDGYTYNPTSIVLDQCLANTNGNLYCSAK